MTVEKVNGDLRNASLNRVIDGSKLTLTVSPCSWMYQGYGLQVRVEMEGGGNVTVRDKQIAFENATMDHLGGLFDKVSLCKCSRCGKPAFDPKSVETNRNGFCETCFIGDLDRKFKAELEKEQKKLQALHKKRKAEGYTHHVCAWIHGTGDDYQIDFWTKGLMSDEDIKKYLMKKGSVSLDDFVVQKL